MATRAAALLAAAAAAGGAPAVPSVRLGAATGGGAMMPIVGLGTGGYGSNFRDHAYPFVLQWLQLGGRRIDTALSYHDQVLVGQAMADSGVPRADIFVTAKLGTPPEFNCSTPADARASMRQILSQLNTTYVDLLLLHFPAPLSPSEAGTAGCWAGMVALQREGLARAVGVSNFCAEQLAWVDPPPAVHQIEFHPFYHNDDLAARSRAVGAVVNGYSPMGGPDVAPARNGWNSTILDLPVVRGIAAAHNCTPGQAVLAWEYRTHGAVVNPRTNHTQHMKDNLGLSGAVWWQDVQLSASESAALDALQGELMAGEINPGCAGSKVVPIAYCGIGCGVCVRTGCDGVPATCGAAGRGG